MEEKAHYSYQGNTQINLEKVSNFSRVLQISNLQPVSVRWEDNDAQTHSELFYLDFFEEVVYDEQFRNTTTQPLGDAVLDILREKKTVFQQPVLPEGFVENIIGNRQKVQEGRPHARKD